MVWQVGAFGTGSFAAEGAHYKLKLICSATRRKQTTKHTKHSKFVLINKIINKI